MLQTLKLPGRTTRVHYENSNLCDLYSDEIGVIFYSSKRTRIFPTYKSSWHLKEPQQKALHQPPFSTDLSIAGATWVTLGGRAARCATVTSTVRSTACVRSAVDSAHVKSTTRATTATAAPTVTMASRSASVSGQLLLLVERDRALTEKNDFLFLTDNSILNV